MGLALGVRVCARNRAPGRVAVSVLEQEKIPVDYLAGTSSGAMLAIAYASGHTLDQIEAQARSTRFKDFGQWKLSWMGLSSNQRLEHYPRRFLGVGTFEELRAFPWRSRQHRSGHGRGCLLQSRSAGAGASSVLRVSWNVCARGDRRQDARGRFSGCACSSGRSARPGLPTWSSRCSLEAANARKPTSIVDVIGLSFAILQRHADLEWRAKADIIVEPKVRNFVWDDFDRTSELIAAGEAAARAALSKIGAALTPKPSAEQIAARPASPRWWPGHRFSNQDERNWARLSRP